MNKKDEKIKSLCELTSSTRTAPLRQGAHLLLKESERTHISGLMEKLQRL